MLKSVKIAGTGSYLPARVLTNRDLEQMVDTSDQWIRERTGIVERHIAAPDEFVTDLAKQASERALAAANITAQDLDAIIVATVTGDQVMPSAACTLQAKLGCPIIMAFDISAACSGFLYALNLANMMISTGQARHVLVVGSETLSRIVDFKDRETCILFGDGAGAFVLSETERGKSSTFHSFKLSANGQLGELLYLNSSRPPDPLGQEVTLTEVPYIRMKGREIFKSAVRAMAESCRYVLDARGINAGDVDWFIPHQANTRIIDAVGESLGIDKTKAIVNIAETGNTSSASIPIAFDQAVRDGRIERGQTILLGAFGAGLTYGAGLLDY